MDVDPPDDGKGKNKSKQKDTSGPQPAINKRNRNKNRAQEGRRITGAKTMKALEEKLDENLFSSLQKQFDEMRLGELQHSTPISITTRCLGFLTFLIYTKLCESLRVFVVVDRCTIHQMYRVVLAMFEYRLSLVYRKPVTGPFQPFDCDHVNLGSEFRDAIRSSIDMFKPLSDVINYVGVLTYHQKTWVPRIPTNAPRYLKLLLSNLRDTVLRMSDNATPVAERRAFRLRSSIPGAIWNNDLIVNADEIMPNGYNGQLLMDDVSRFSALYRLASVRFQDMKGVVTYDTVGSPALLTSLHVCLWRVCGTRQEIDVEQEEDNDAMESDGEVVDEPTLSRKRPRVQHASRSRLPPVQYVVPAEHRFGATNFWTTVELATHPLTLGYLALYGEIVTTDDDGRLPDWTASRSGVSATTSSHYDWRGLASTLM